VPQHRYDTIYIFLYLYLYFCNCKLSDIDKQYSKKNIILILASLKLKAQAKVILKILRNTNINIILDRIIVIHHSEFPNYFQITKKEKLILF